MFTASKVTEPYQEYICKYLTHLLPKRELYNRFVELEKEVLLLLTVFVKQVMLRE